MQKTDKQADKRRNELLKIAGDSATAAQLVDEMIFIEAQLSELKALPMIRRNPNNPAQAKPTPTAKLYKELLQQYVNIVKAIEHISGADGEEISPLRQYLNSINGND
jgi:hypothetical protein